MCSLSPAALNKSVFNGVKKSLTKNIINANTKNAVIGGVDLVNKRVVSPGVDQIIESDTPILELNTDKKK